MAVRPADGRPLGVGAEGSPRRSAVRRDPNRVPARPGPLVAGRRPEGTLNHGTADRVPPVRPPLGRVRRFLHRYGWRAYAIPLLTVATLATLADLALHGVDRPATSVAATQSPVVTPPTAEPPSTAESSADDVLADDGFADVDLAPTGTPSSTEAPTYVEKGAGTVSVVDVSSRVYGSGPLRRFAVEIEDGIRVDGPVFAQAVRATLADPRSWGSGGRYSFQQVGAAQVAAGQYDFKVTLISPGNMDAYCPGLRTNGYTSCRVGERAVVNLARWETAVPHYDGDIAAYRHYVVNHEVGHALGNGHQPCPGAGAVAPVMLQQTLGLDGCVPNAWPFP